MTEYGEGCVAIPGILWLQKWFAGSLDMQLEVWNDSEPEEQSPCMCKIEQLDGNDACYHY